MKKFQLIWRICFTLALVGFTGYAVADTFLISRVYSTVRDASTNATSGLNGANVVSAADDGGSSSDTASPSTDSDTSLLGGNSTNKNDAETDNSSLNSSETTDSSASNSTSGSATVTDTTYSDDHIAITLTDYRVSNTTVHVADVVIDDAAYLKTYLAQGAYGKNVTEKTSEMADDTHAILAVNGDYYGARESGYVIRNGVLYRSTASRGQEDLVIYADGTFAVVSEDEVSAQELLDDGAVQVLSFGPALLKNGKVAVSTNTEVDQSMNSNPRTAVGVIDEDDGSLHYVFVVSDGRTSSDEGLSLYELAEFLQGLGVTTAYNLDGGGSSTMVFNGTVVNTPTGGHAGHGSHGNGSGASERAVSDIVYIGY